MRNAAIGKLLWWFRTFRRVLLALFGVAMRNDLAGTALISGAPSFRKSGIQSSIKNNSSQEKPMNKATPSILALSRTAGISRREAIRGFVIATATVALNPLSRASAEAAPPAPPAAIAAPPPAAEVTGPFTLPALGYAYDALEPHIDAETMQIHHDKHHAAYVKNLNAAVAKHPELGTKTIEAILADLSAVPEDIRTAVRNNGGGHYNHSLFWTLLKKGGGGAPTGEIAAAITRDFGSYAAFQEALTKAATGQFGSGWAWLTADAGGKLAVSGTPNQDTPLSQGLTPLLGIDVWEHAYYLKYRNVRASYVAAFYNLINWDTVNARYAGVKKA